MTFSNTIRISVGLFLESWKLALILHVRLNRLTVDTCDSAEQLDLLKSVTEVQGQVHIQDLQGPVELDFLISLKKIVSDSTTEPALLIKNNKNATGIKFDGLKNISSPFKDRFVFRGNGFHCNHADFETFGKALGVSSHYDVGCDENSNLHGPSVPSSSQSSVSSEAKDDNTGVIIAVCCSVGVLALIAIGAAIFFISRNKNKKQEPSEQPKEPKRVVVDRETVEEIESPIPWFDAFKDFDQQALQDLANALLNFEFDGKTGFEAYKAFFDNNLFYMVDSKKTKEFKSGKTRVPGDKENKTKDFTPPDEMPRTTNEKGMKFDEKNMTFDRETVKCFDNARVKLLVGCKNDHLFVHANYIGFKKFGLNEEKFIATQHPIVKPVFNPFQMPSCPKKVTKKKIQEESRDDLEAEAQIEEENEEKATAAKNKKGPLGKNKGEKKVKPVSPNLELNVDNFWAMIMTAGPKVVVNLNGWENGNYLTTGTVFSKYFTQTDNFNIIVQDSGKGEGVITHTVSVTCMKNNKTHKFVLVDVQQWPDNSVPKIGIACFMTSVFKRVDSVPGIKNGPVVVHCDAGIGRTCSFLCGYAMYKVFHQKRDFPKIYSMQEWFVHIRKQRWFGIHNSIQFLLLPVFLLATIVAITKHKDLEKQVDSFMKKYNALICGNEQGPVKNEEGEKQAEGENKNEGENKTEGEKQTEEEKHTEKKDL